MEQTPVWDFVESRPSDINTRDRFWNGYGSWAALTKEQKEQLGSVSYVLCPSRRAGVAYTDDHHVGPVSDYVAVMLHVNTDGEMNRDGWWNHYHPTNSGHYESQRGPFRVAGTTASDSANSEEKALKRYCRDSLAWWQDGTSNQVLIGEKQIPTGKMGNCSDAYDCSYYSSGGSWREYGVGRCGGGVDVVLARSPDDISGDGKADIRSAFGSHHPGVINFVFGDGSVRSLSVTIPHNNNNGIYDADWKTFTRLCHVADGGVVSLD